MTLQLMQGGRRSLNDIVTEEVRVMMARRGTRQVDLTNLLGVSQSGISERVRGKREWTVSEIETLANHWQISVGVLLGMQNDPHPGGPDGGRSYAARDSNPEPAVSLSPAPLRLVTDAHPQVDAEPTSRPAAA